MVQQCGEIANKYTQTLKWNVNVAWLYHCTYGFIFSYSHKDPQVRLGPEAHALCSLNNPAGAEIPLIK